MISAILHLILAFLTAVGAVGIYYKFVRKTGYIKELFCFFVFFTAYHLFLSLPFFFSSGNLAIMAWGYNFAILFLFLICVSVVVIELQILNIPNRKKRFFMAGFFSLGLITVLLQTFNFCLPIIHKSGFIIWNVNILSKLIATMAASLTALSWSALLFKNWPKNVCFTGKLKTVLLGAGTFMFALACVYFFAYNVAMVISAFIFVSVGTILCTAGFLIPKRKNQISDA